MSTNTEFAVRNGHAILERGYAATVGAKSVKERQKRFHMQHDAGNHILDANCVYEDGAFILLCLPKTLPALFTVRFTAPEAFSAGDVIRHRKAEYEVKGGDMEAAPAGAFAAGAVVHCDIDKERGFAFICATCADCVGRDEIDSILAGKADASAGFVDCDCTNSAGVIELSERRPLPDPMPEMVTVRFVAGSDFVAGDVVRLAGIEYPVLDATGSALAAGAYATGTVVDLHIGENVAFFKGGVVGGADPCLDGWNVSTGDDAEPVGYGIHVPEATMPTEIIVDNSFNFGNEGIKEVVVGGYTTFFLMNNGSVWSCGLNNSGQLCRTGGEELPLGVILIDDVKKVFPFFNTHFLKFDGTVWNCGQNESGHLGRVTITSTPDETNLGQVPINKKVIKIIPSTLRTHYLCEDGTVWNCGNNVNGELGRNVGNATNIISNLGQIPDFEEVIDIAASDSHTLFLKRDGTVWSCGDNEYGQLGRAGASGASIVRVNGISNVVQMEAGAWCSFFLRSDGTVWSCGNNRYGHLGRVTSNGTSTSINLAQIPSLSDIEHMTCVSSCSLFLGGDGSVWSCGYSHYGALGRPMSIGTNTTVNLGKIPNLLPVKQMASFITHSMFMLENGEIFGCGNGTYGELVRSVNEKGSNDNPNFGPIPLSGLGGGANGYTDGTLLIKYNCDASKQKVRIYDDGCRSVKIVPDEVYQVESGQAINRYFLIHGA